MASTEEYLAEIKNRREGRKSIQIDFGALPPGVDRDAIGLELSKDLPGDYGAEIYKRMKGGKSVELDYAQAIQEPSGEIVSELKKNRQRVSEAIFAGTGGIEKAATGLARGMAPYFPSPEHILGLLAESHVPKTNPEQIREPYSAGEKIGGLLAQAADNSVPRIILNALDLAKRKEEQAFGIRSSFSQAVKDTYEQQMARARGMAPVEEGPQPILDIARRASVETAAEAVKFLSEWMPVTPLEHAEAIMGGKLIGKGAGELAARFPYLYSALTKVPASEAGVMAMRELPISMQSEVQSIRFRVKKALGIPQETGLVAEDLDTLSEAIGESNVVSPAAMELRARLKEQGLSRADIIRSNSRLKDYEIFRRGLTAKQAESMREPVRQATEAPEATIVKSVQEAHVDLEKESPMAPQAPPSGAIELPQGVPSEQAPVEQAPVGVPEPKVPQEPKETIRVAQVPVLEPGVVSEPQEPATGLEQPTEQAPEEPTAPEQPPFKPPTPTRWSFDPNAPIGEPIGYIDANGPEGVEGAKAAILTIQPEGRYGDTHFEARTADGEDVLNPNGGTRFNSGEEAAKAVEEHLRRKELEKPKEEPPTVVESQTAEIKVGEEKIEGPVVSIDEGKGTAIIETPQGIVEVPKEDVEAGVPTDFHSGEYRLATSEPGGVGKMVKGQILGHLGIHKMAPGKYAITHVPAGLNIMRGLDYAGARGLVRKLSVVDFNFTDKKNMPPDTVKRVAAIMGGDPDPGPSGVVPEQNPAEAMPGEPPLTPEETGPKLEEEQKGEQISEGVNAGEVIQGEPGAPAEPGVVGEANVSPVEGAQPQPIEGPVGGGPVQVPEPTGGRVPGQARAGGETTPRAGQEPAGGEPSGVGIGQQGEPLPGPGQEGAGNLVPEPPKPPTVKPVKPAATGRNYHIESAANLGFGTPISKYKANVEAIRLLKKIEGEGRLATPEEQAVLAKYVGWGGIPQAFDSYNTDWRKRYDELEELLTDEEYRKARASTPNAHYTSFDVVNAMWKAMERMGFVGGRVLEPSMGIGNFFGIMSPKLVQESKLFGVELDDITGRIAKLLYPDATVKIDGFERVNLPGDFFDLVISNVPFGDYGVTDPEYAKTGLTSRIHNYFFAKALDKARPGGMVVFITSHFTMDAKDSKVRKYIAERADLVDAIRLPNTAFKANAETEVTTDIIILRKKGGREVELKSRPWIESVESRDAKTGERYFINEHFEKNPAKMLGRPSLEGTMYGGEMEFTLNLDGRPLAKSLEEAFRSLPDNIMAPVTVGEEILPEEAIPAGDEVKEGGFQVIEGKVYRKVKGKMELVPGAPLARVKALLAVRDATREVYRTQLSDAPEAEINSAIKALNKSYDSAVEKYGRMGDKENAKAILDDPDYFLLKALESMDKETGKLVKADIFTKRVITPTKKIEKTDTAKDALMAILDRTGRLNIPEIAKLSSRSEKEVVSELFGLIYNDPENGWVLADEYLSGNVRAKLKTAERAAEVDQQFSENVEALRKVQPTPLEAGEISVHLGDNWISTEDIEEFLAHLTDVSGFKVNYIQETSDWIVEYEGYRRYMIDDSAKNNEIWGTPRYSAINLVRDTLNGKVPTVYDRDSQGNSVVNQSETTVARDRQEKIKEEFKKWIFEDQERRDRLVAYYNEHRNNYRPRLYDGSHISLPGANPAIPLRPHQKNGIWRIVSSRANTLLAYAVGAGKTYTMIGAGMELRRTGLRKKPMYAVPNHLLGQWELEFAKLYPSAKVLIGTESDFIPDRRKTFTGRIATGDWDAVVIPQSSFELIGMSQRAVEEMFNEQIDGLLSAIESMRAAGQRSKSMSVKAVEKMIKRLQARMEKVLDSMSKDTTMTFEELGVDHLFVDESQEYKNLFYYTKMSRVAGLQNPMGSQRAFDMFMKVRYLNKLNNGNGVTFATGTPITNTIGEMFNIQRYLQEDVLREAGIHNFDAWAMSFGEMVTRIELATEGGNKFVQKTRFSRFTNVHELLNRYLQVADVQTAEMLKLPVPELEGGKPEVVSSPISDRMKEYIIGLSKRAEKVHSGSVDPKTDNMLKICTDGRKAALDMRLVESHATDNPDSKLNKAIENVFKIWKDTKKEKLTQLVWSDLGTPKEGEGFNVYEDIRRKLVNLGIPKGEVAFVHEAKTKQEKNELFRKMNNGTIRVLIGSTRKMGTGMNVQRLLVASHDLDAPWRPDEVEQRMGRILRQGNKNAKVKIFRYVTIGSFDVNLWQILENKAGFISQLAPGKLKGRVLDDVDENVLTFEQVKAVATGDNTIIEKFKTDSEIRKLSSLEASHRSAKYRSESEIAAIPARIDALTKFAEAIRLDAEALKIKEVEKKDDKGNVTKEVVFEIKLGDKTFTRREEAGAEIRKLASQMHDKSVFGKELIGDFRGREVLVNITRSGADTVGVRGVTGLYEGKISDSAVGTIQSLEHSVSPESFARKAENAEKEAAVLSKRKADLEKELNKPFEHEAKLKELLALKEKLDGKLGLLTGDLKGAPEEGEKGKDEEEEGDDEESAEDHDYDAGGLKEKSYGSPNEKTSKGAFIGGYQTKLGQLHLVHPMQMPEIVKLATELSGAIPKINTRIEARGRFLGVGGGVIELNPEIFKDPVQAAATLAHEIGHLIDYLPDETLKRGNLLGRLHSLRSFMKNTFGQSVVTNKEIRAELISVSEWWRPYDKASAPALFKAYRNSGKELYADALSVLINTPGSLETMAPKFLQTFFDTLDKKPDVKREYFALQDLISGRGGDLLEVRQADIREMFQKGEELSKLKFQERQAARKSIGQRLMQVLQDAHRFLIQKNPIHRKADNLEKMGVEIPPDEDPRNIIEESDMVANDVWDMLTTVDNEITQPMNKAGLTEGDIGELMFLERVLSGDRGDLANPLGHNPKSAQEQMAHLEKKLGAEKISDLKGFARALREINFSIVEELVEAGAYNSKMFEEKIRPNKETYSANQVLDYVDDFVSAAVHKQIGSLKGINNPYISTLLKMVSSLRLLARQRAKNNVRDFLLKNYPKEIEKAKPSNPGEKIVSFHEKEGWGVMTVLEDGKMVGYYVDPYIAEAMEKQTPSQVQRVLGLLGALNHKIFHPLLLTYNPGFALAFNPLRDIKRTLKGMPGLTISQLINQMWKDRGHAWNRANGIHDPLIQEMVKNKAMMVPMEDFILTEEEDQYERMLTKAHVMQGPMVKHGWLSSKARRILESVRIMGSAIESLPKIAGYNLRKEAGEKGRSLSFNTRHYTGTPHWLNRGSATWLTNPLFMFSNIFLQDVESNIKMATMPKTRSGYWYRTIQFDILPRLMVWAATLGLAGKWLKDFYDRIPEYDKTNYTCVPLGAYPGGPNKWKAVYLRIPHDEAGRFTAGLTWKMLNGLRGDPKAVTQILDFGSGQLPNVSPAITIANAWQEYLTGKNPREPFRGRNIMSDDTYKAGGYRALKKMMYWTSNQAGLMKIATYDDASKTSFEAALEFAPWFNRLFKVSDHGLTEKANKVKEQDEAARAREHLDRTDEVRGFKVELARLKKLDDAEILSPEGKARLARMKYFDSNVVQKKEKMLRSLSERGDTKDYKAMRESLDRQTKGFPWKAKE